MRFSLKIQSVVYHTKFHRYGITLLFSKTPIRCVSIDYGSLQVMDTATVVFLK